MNEFAPLRANNAVHPQFAWSAQMVRPTADAGVGHPASFLRKEFDVAAVSGNEVLRITALGLYRAFINGKRVGNDLPDGFGHLLWPAGGPLHRKTVAVSTMRTPSVSSTIPAMRSMLICGNPTDRANE